ncbi:MAG: STAS domain-containing protein [Pseudomonadota bacterium]
MVSAKSTTASAPAFTSTVTGEVLVLEGALNLNAMPLRLAETQAYSSQSPLPDCLTIDFRNVHEIDSSGVALLLHWRREATELGKALRYIHLPPNLASLAELYGVADLIHCPSQNCT